MTNDQKDSTRTALEVGVKPMGYRLPDRARVGAVRLQIADLERSLAYYTHALGFRVLSRTESAAVLGPQSGPAVPLIELHEQRGVRPVPRRGLLGLYHFAILL